MSDFYSMWSKRIAEKSFDIGQSVARIHQGMKELTDSGALDSMLYTVCDRKIGSESVCAVDGGEGLQELSGIAVYMIRASGFFNKGPPSPGTVSGGFIRDLDLGVLPVDRQTKARVQFMRAQMEYSVATRLIEEHKPDYLLIDGSLLVGVEIDPIKTDEYYSYIATLRKMLLLAQDSGVRVVGVSEDSTSRGLIAYLSDKGLTKSASDTLSALTDSSLVQLYLQNRETFEPTATRPFIPVSNKGRNWIRENTNVDFSFPTFYLQATKFGRAMRVDFPSKGKDIAKKAQEIAAYLTSLSQIPKRFGYPLPLYLAHSDAELPKKLMDRTCLLVQKQIFSKWADEYLSIYSKRRRDSRPGDLDA